MLTNQLSQLAKYLPRDILRGESSVYAYYHSRAVNVNGENELYTIEYFAFHILWISFMQKITYMLYKKDPEGVGVAFAHEGNVIRELESAQSLYDLSSIDEKKLCEIAKHPVIGFHQNKIDNMRDFVKKRDHIAHCSGVLDLSEEDVVHLANNCLRYTNEIHQKLTPLILESWRRFILNLQADNSQYSLLHDAVIDYLTKENMSVNDILLVLSAGPIYGANIEYAEGVARMHLALVVDDFDLESGVDPEVFKGQALSLATSDEQKALVQDESEAYVRFAAGLA